MDGRYRIEMLGGLRILQGERVITRFRTQKFGALLAYLAYHLRQAHPREALIEMLWPETEPDTGRHRLSMALSSLRKQLEPPGIPTGAVLQADRFHIRLNPNTVTTDVAEFEDALRRNDLERAIALYRGPLLPGFYEDWIVPEILRLEELHSHVRQQWESRQKESGPPLPVLADSAPIHQRLPSNVHLPLQFTRFFGREEEITRLTAMLSPFPLPSCHLLTLSGPGGSGKTRLAIETARQMADTFPGGVWFVPLADLSDPRLIPSAILDAMRLPRSPNLEPMEQAVGYLNGIPAPVLLLMDNLEHLLQEERRKSEDGASVVKALLERCPSLTCLVTSRQRLDLEGEREFPVMPLSVPMDGFLLRGDEEETLNPQLSTLHAFASVQLFVDRAQAIRPDFQLTHRNAPVVSALCARLEGIPLAIELAAARTQVMTPAQMLTQLERRFDFLVSRRRDTTDRHRTLRDAIEWSYRLLSLESQRFFCRLSVFRGGWTVEAAEAVGEEPLALDYLNQLCACSLVLAEEKSGDAMRFRMLETFREFGQETMSQQEGDDTRQRHLHFFLALAERAEPQLFGPEQESWLPRLETEHDNLRIALTWSLEIDRETGLLLAGALGRFWLMRGYFTEGRKWLEEMLKAPSLHITARAKGFCEAGALADYQGERSVAHSLYEQSLAIYRELGNKRGMAAALNGLGDIAFGNGDERSARTLYEQSLALFREIADRYGIALSLYDLARPALSEGDCELAERLLLESLALYREFGDMRGIAWSLRSLATVTAAQGDYMKARALYEEDLSIVRRLEDPASISYSVGYVGEIACRQGDLALARSLCEERLMLCRQRGDLWDIAASLNILGTVVIYTGDYALAHSHFEQSLAMFTEIGEKMKCLSLLGLGHVAFYQGDYAQAHTLYQEAYTLLNEAQHQDGVIHSLLALGNVAAAEDNYPLARSLYEQALELCRERKRRWGVESEPKLLHNLGRVACLEGDYPKALSLYKESLGRLYERRAKGDIAWSFEGFAQLALAQCKPERSARLFGAADVLRETIGSPLPPNECENYARQVSASRAALGDAAFMAAWKKGRAMTLEQAISYALDET